MLKTPDAALITEPGRAYLQVGNNEIYELFQSAYSGAPYEKESEEKTIDNRVYLINDLGQGQVLNQDLSADDNDNRLQQSELDAVIDHVSDVYETQEHVEVRKPWLPSLPSSLANHSTIDSVNSENSTDLDLNVVLGKVDIPEEQLQKELMIDLQREGNILQVASSGYGKTMFLGNTILNLASKNSVDNLNMYLLDFGTGGLGLYRELPHVADYITIDDDEKFEKFLTLIQEEINERKKIISNAMTQNFSIHNRSQSDKLNSIVVMVDQVDMLKEKGLDVENLFTKLLRDGVSLGIYFIMTSSRSADVRFATLNQIKHKIAGFTFDASEALQLVGRSQWTLSDIKGRVLVKTDNVNVAQLYLPVDFKDDLEYTQNVLSVIGTIKEKNAGTKAKSIAVLPEELFYSDLNNFEPLFEADFYVGLDTESVKLVGTNIKDEPLLIIGQQKSGKTTVLSNIIKQVNGETMILDSSQRLLSVHTNKKNTTYAYTKEGYHESLDLLGEVVNKRKDDYEEVLLKNSNLLPGDYYSTLENYYLIIDDTDYLNELAKDHNDGLDIISSALETGIKMIVSIDSNKSSSLNKYLSIVKSSSQALIVGNPNLLNILNLRTSQYPQLGEGRLGVNEGMWNVMTIKEEK